jgi:hypothetical protein
MAGNGHNSTLEKRTNQFRFAVRSGSDLGPGRRLSNLRFRPEVEMGHKEKPRTLAGLCSKKTVDPKVNRCLSERGVWFASRPAQGALSLVPAAVFVRHRD